MSGLFLIFLALVAMILHFGFWPVIGGIFLGLFWIVCVIALIIAFIFAIFYIVDSFG